jgi:hypothetical protein
LEITAWRLWRNLEPSCPSGNIIKEGGDSNRDSIRKGPKRRENPRGECIDAAEFSFVSDALLKRPDISIFCTEPPENEDEQVSKANTQFHVPMPESSHQAKNNELKIWNFPRFIWQTR